MRQAQTNMRYKQDEIIALKKAGLNLDKKEEQLGQIKNQYYYISKTSDLKPVYDRADFPGFDIKKFKQLYTYPQSYQQ